jgi:signal transduction histidine kinase
MLDVKNQRVVVNGGAYIFCDRRWTAEALTNIVKNAHEHSPEGGEIAVAAGANPICAWISVTDSGAGVERDDIKKIFKRFETGGNGYGIGLPLALSIMRGQNGDIEVTGNTFTMKFYNEIK